MKKYLLWVMVPLLLCACASGDEAATIRQMIHDGAQNAQNHDVNALMAYLAPGFKAHPGEYGSKSLKGVLFRGFKYYGNFKIYHPVPLVDIDGSKSNGKATVYFVIVRKDYLLPDLKSFYDDPQGWIAAVGHKADLYELDLTFQKKDGRWKVWEARLNTIKG